MMMAMMMTTAPGLDAIIINGQRYPWRLHCHILAYSRLPPFLDKPRPGYFLPTMYLNKISCPLPPPDGAMIWPAMKCCYIPAGSSGYRGRCCTKKTYPYYST